jgi:hypothetical protein
MDEVPGDDEVRAVRVARSGLEDRRHTIEIVDVALHVGRNEESASIRQLNHTTHGQGGYLKRRVSAKNA